MKFKFDIKKIFLFFLIYQPFLDCAYLYSDGVINFFGFSPTTIIRLLVILIYCLFLFFEKKDGRKIIISYMSVIFLYVIIHHFVGIGIDDSLIYKSFKYNLLEELFYITRMLLPVGVIYITYRLGFTKKDLKTVIKYSSVVFCAIVILLNVAGIALTSYGSKLIGGTIFDWLNPEISRYLLASKGWFNSANQVSAVIIIFVVMMEYFVLSELKKSDLMVLIVLIFSSLMIGTRISTIAVFAIVVFLMLGYFVIEKINKKKFCFDKNRLIYCLLIIIFTGIVFNFAPIVNCEGSNYKCILSIDGGLTSENIIETPENLKYDGDTCNFLKKTPANPEYYNKLYPCSENLIFWDNFAKNEIYSYANNRTMEILVTNDAYSKIENTNVNLFGMSRSRFLTAEIYLEKDIYVHFYTLGIFGILLFLIIPYLVPVFIFLFKMLKNKNFDYYSLCLCFSIIVIFAISYLSGHILDELVVTLYLGFIVGIIVNSTYRRKEKELVKRTLIVNDERMVGGVSILLEDILNNIDKNIEIDLLILHNNGTRLENLPPNVNIIYGTKFFRTIDLHIGEVLRTKNIGLIVNKVMLVLLMKTHLISHRIKSERDKILKYRYEQEIAFKDGFCGLFVAYGDANRKVQWLHSDYAKKDYLENYRSLFLKVFNEIDTFIAVSKTVGVNFNNIYKQSDKTIVINNLVDTDKIQKLSIKENIKLDGTVNFISVGRLHCDKGFHRVIRVLSRLNKEKKLNDIKYYIVGNGEEYFKLDNLIKEEKLDNVVKLLGKKENPYPYFKAADMFIMSSLHESFGLVVVEALCLGVPVLSVELATIHELLDENYGLIVDNTDDDLYNGIKDILDNVKSIEIWKNNLKEYNYDNEKILKQIEKILDVE